MSRLIETVQQLTGDFVLLDLGSAKSVPLFHRFPDLQKAATLIEVDAQNDGTPLTGQFHRTIRLNQAVAGTAGPRIFYGRAFPECSSFLEPKEELVRAYGLETYFKLREAMALECATLPELLQRLQITRVDFLKTDLEGLDFEVLASAPDIVRQALCLQCELRFQPIFKGEPHFHEVVSHLAKLGFELVSFWPEIWKYRAGNRNLVRDGRTVWTDAIFFLSPAAVRERFREKAWKAFVKQVILSRMLGLTNFAQFLLAETQDEYAGAIGEELARWVRPKFNLAMAAAQALARLPFGLLALEVLRRICRRGYIASALYKDEVIGASRPR